VFFSSSSIFFPPRSGVLLLIVSPPQKFRCDCPAVLALSLARSEEMLYTRDVCEQL
jgi:hypothetical protein